MAGYSGTPLPKKLGIKDGFRVALVEIPAEVRAELKDTLAACVDVKVCAVNDVWSGLKFVIRVKDRK